MKTQQIIEAHKVTAATYAKTVDAVGGFTEYVRRLGGIFTELIGKSDKVTDADEFRKRCDYVQGLMQIFRFCYWNGSTWWWHQNSTAESFYTTKQTKTCPTGTIEQLCSGAGGRTRITNCNYGVDTLAKKCGYSIWSCDYEKMLNAGKKKITRMQDLKTGDLVHFFSGSISKKNWRHVAIVYSTDGGKVVLADFGKRFITTGKPLHAFPAEYSAYAANWLAVRWLDLKEEEKKEVIPMLNGIDVSSFQAGIDLTKVPGDFAIVKTTQGIWYTNTDWKRQAKSAVDGKKLLGLYHYAEARMAASQEADFFLAAAEPYIGKACLFLDWERTDNDKFGTQGGVTWVKAFMDRVHDKTGVWPLLYVQLSEVQARDWSSVAKNSGLWLAQYVVQNRSGYKQDYSHGSTAAWNYPAIWQYTSGGYLKGWSGRLDLNVAYMTKEAWAAYAKGTRKEEPKKEEPKKDTATTLVPATVKHGSTGAAVRMLQGYLNITVDGKALNETVGAIKAFQKKKGLTIDGVCGPKTWTVIMKDVA